MVRSIAYSAELQVLEISLFVDDKSIANTLLLKSLVEELRGLNRILDECPPQNDGTIEKLKKLKSEVCGAMLVELGF